MRNLTTKSLLSLCLLTSSLLTYAQSKISGTIVDEITGKPLAGTTVWLALFDSVRTTPIIGYDSIYFQTMNIHDTVWRDTAFCSIMKTFSNSDGKYHFQSLPAGIYQVSVFHRTKKLKSGKYEGELDWTKGIILNGKNDVTNTFALHVTCEYEKTKHLKHCPNCHKKDEVRPIRWGLVLDPEHLDPKYYYNGYCVIERCHPTKHCSRCNLDF